jgi:hypothetical protein
MKFRVRADGSNGLSSTWRETPLLTLSYTPETILTAVSYNGAWNQFVLPSAINGSARRTTNANDRAGFDFAGVSVVVVGAKRSTGGTADFHVDNRLVESVDSASVTDVTRYPVFIQNDLAAGRRRIEIFNRVAGREFVLDGFVTMSAQ